MRDSNIIFKVVGTTFRPLPSGVFIKVYETFEQNNVPTALAKAILAPEPDNVYDPNAVQVIIELDTGAPFTIGYIGKDDPWQKRITQPVLATLRIVDYSVSGAYNASYNIIDIEME